MQTISETNEIDKIYEFYQNRYNLLKMATECNIPIKFFESLSSRDRILYLSNRLKEIGKVNLASFFYGKLFEATMDIDALLCKIDCLIDLSEFEEAFRLNQTGWEIYLEVYGFNRDFVEKKLTFQKGLIAFYTGKFFLSKSICEESILQYKSPEFFHLLAANMIALSMSMESLKLLNKYAHKFSTIEEFTLEIIVFLLNAGHNDKSLDFLNSIYNLSPQQRGKINDFIDKYYSFNHNKSVLKEYINKEINIQG